MDLLVQRVAFPVSALLLLLLGSSAWAGELTGHVTDAATGLAIEQARVEVTETDQTTTTDSDGFFSFELPTGTYELAIEATLGDETYQSRLVNQRVPQTRPAQARLYTDHFLNRGHPPRERAFGLPNSSGSLPETGPDTLELSKERAVPGDPTHLSVPDELPTTIRVGRREDPSGQQGCSDSVNPIVAIDEMALDEYVEGVLPPEIGVFQSLSGVSEVYKAFAIAAKSYALYFVLHYDEDNRRRLDRSVPPFGYSWFHIDDTACNQRYSDDRLDITTQAAEAVEGMILVSANDANELGKYEYAASCGRHGTRPAYQSAVVSDTPSENACVNGWCGHNDCAGHEDHPHVTGRDRCLVRGICQWGAASWGEEGQPYQWMLDHYQPNLQRRELDTPRPNAVALAGYVYTDEGAIADTGVPAATVELSDGQSTTTNDEGSFYFARVDLDLETVEISASKTGYEPNTRSKQLAPGVTNRGSIQLRPVDDGSDDTGSDDAGMVADVSPGADAAPSDTAREEQPGRASRFGPLVTRSHGTDGGCASSGSAPPSVAWLSTLALLLVGRRRRA